MEQVEGTVEREWEEERERKKCMWVTLCTSDVFSCLKILHPPHRALTLSHSLHTHLYHTNTLHLAHRYLLHTHHGTSLWHRLTVAGAHVLCGLCIAVKREWIFSKYDVFVDEMGRMWTGQSPESQRQPFSHSALKIKTPLFQISPIRHILLDIITFIHIYILNTNIYLLNTHSSFSHNALFCQACSGAESTAD